MTKLSTPRLDFGTLVYLRANPDIAGVITGFLMRPGGWHQYCVTWGNDCEERPHFETELLEEKPYGAPGTSE